MPVIISREELYAKVWGQPMIHLASEFGMSDVGLKKICVKHRIPVPPRGYWAKKASGKKVTKTALRKLSDPAINRIVIHRNSLGSLHREVVEAAERAQELGQRMDEQSQSGARLVIRRIVKLDPIGLMVRPLGLFVNPRIQNPFLHELIDKSEIDAHAASIIVDKRCPGIFIMSRRHPGIEKFLLGGMATQIAIHGARQMIVLRIFRFQVEIAEQDK